MTKTEVIPQYLCMDGSAAYKRPVVEPGEPVHDRGMGVAAAPARTTFYELYEHELSYVYKTLGRLGVAPSEIPDAVHDVFVVVHRRWADIDFERSLRPWLFGVARKIAAAHRRKRGRELPTADLERATEPSPHAERDFLWRVLAALDDDRREVIVLHDLEGYTGAEIAAVLQIPANTVHSRLRLGRQDMQAIVRKLRGEP